MNLKSISDHDEILRVAYKWLHMQGFAARSSSIWAERIKSCHVEEWCHLILPHKITSETFSHLFTQGIAVTFSSLEFFPHSQRLYASSAFEATPVKLVLLVSIIKFQYVKSKENQSCSDQWHPHCVHWILWLLVLSCSGYRSFLCIKTE